MRSVFPIMTINKVKSMKIKHSSVQRTIFLVVSALILCLSANFEFYSEETGEAKSVEWRLSPLCEHIEFRQNTHGSYANKVSITITPFSKTTYFQVDNTASRARYVPMFGMVYVKEYIIDEYGTHLLTGKSVINRKDIDSDYYSSLLHQNAGGTSFGIFSHFGTFSIK